MSQLTQRGIRTGKVVLESPERNGQLLKLPAVDDAMRSQLDGIKSVLGTANLLVCKI
jgi:hypothetical protein